MATGLQHYFGIDFGTTNSATVGFLVMDHKPECVKYGDEEGRPIPSVVAIDKTTGEIYTGRNAWDKKMQLSESCEYISSVKTILGGLLILGFIMIRSIIQNRKKEITK